MRRWKWLLLVCVALPGCAKAKAESNVVAVVNRVPITQEQFREVLISRMGKAALQQMIEEKLLEQAARQSRASVSDKEVDEVIQRQKKLFATPQEFQQNLAMHGLATESDLRVKLKCDLLIERIIASQATISEKEMRAFYHANQKSFTEPERVQVRDILLSKEENARELLKALRSPQSDFAALAKVFSEDATTRDKGGNRGLERLEELSRPLADAINKLKVGEVSDVINNQGEWHILKLEKRIAGRVKPLNEVRDEVQRLAVRHKTEEEKRSFLQKLRTQARVQIYDERLQAAAAPKK